MNSNADFGKITAKEETNRSTWVNELQSYIAEDREAKLQLLAEKSGLPLNVVMISICTAAGKENDIFCLYNTYQAIKAEELAKKQAQNQNISQDIFLEDNPQYNETRKQLQIFLQDNSNLLGCAEYLGFSPERLSTLVYLAPLTPDELTLLSHRVEEFRQKIELENSNQSKAM